jgi:site-specific recombinase XerD
MEQNPQNRKVKTGYVYYTTFCFTGQQERGKKMKNPNGYGGIVKLSGNRRRPYMIRKTVGWNDKGYPIYKAIGYTETREEALILLADYNKSPYDLDTKAITVSEVYEKWIEIQEISGRRSINTIIAAKTAWNHCTSVYDIPYRKLRAYHIQACMDFCNLSYSSKNAIRSLFVGLDKFALERDIISKSYAALVESIPIPPTSKCVFTDEEISLIWKNADIPEMDCVLILLYSGWRFSELLALKKTDIDIKANTMRGGIKTKNGKNRIVPIHPKILPFIMARYNTPGDYLFQISEKKFRCIWSENLKKIEINHTPHECRHTFRSALDSAGGNKVCIDLLMGHASSGTGERVYTHKTLDELRSTIGLIPY